MERSDCWCGRCLIEEEDVGEGGWWERRRLRKRQRRARRAMSKASPTPRPTPRPTREKVSEMG